MRALASEQVLLSYAQAHLHVQGWSKFAKLAYAAMFMDCSEAFTWGATAILAGVLPNGAASAAAFSVTNQFYRCKSLKKA